jgi:hypothetical protein
LGHIKPPREMLEHVRRNLKQDEGQDFMRQIEGAGRELWSQLRAAGMFDTLSPKEKALANKSPLTLTDQEHLNACWRIESLQVLAWALGRIPSLPPYDTMADSDRFDAKPVQDPKRLIATAALQSESELSWARMVAETWHWRSRTRQLIERGDNFPASLAREGFHTYDDIVRFAAEQNFRDHSIPQPIDGDYPARGKAYRDLTAEEWSEVGSIAVERHFALNWLCGEAPGNRWDETPTDT